MHGAPVSLYQPVSDAVVVVPVAPVVLLLAEPVGEEVVPVLPLAVEPEPEVVVAVAPPVVLLLPVEPEEDPLDVVL